MLDQHKIPFQIGSRRTGVDLRDLDQTIAFFGRSSPDFVINCAAHVGSLNYVTEQAAEVISDNSRMILSMYEAITRVAPQAVVINPVANCAYPAKAHVFIEDEWMDGPLHRSVLSYGASPQIIMDSLGESFEMQHKIRSTYTCWPRICTAHTTLPTPNKAHALNALISKIRKSAEHRPGAIP